MESINYHLKPGNFFTHLASTGLTCDFLRTMQEAGVIRRDVHITAMAFIMDALTPSVLEILAFHPLETRGGIAEANRPSPDELLGTLAEMLECMLTPVEGANLAAGKAILLQELAQARADFNRAEQKKEQDFPAERRDV